MTTSSASPRGGAGGPIFGREREMTCLDALVDGLPDRGATLLVRGEAGIGKSALLSAASGRAEDAGMRVLHATGVQSEAELPFAVLHQLLLPLLDGMDRLPAPQRTALMAAFGMAETREAPDRFMIGLAVLELLSDAAEGGPVLVVADDAQWLDPSTAAVLGFVARRLEYEPIGLLLAIRSGEADPFAEAGIPGIVLGGLENDSADALLAAQGHELAARVRGRLLEEASGNPLALVELPVPLSDDEMRGRTPLPAPLPLTARLEQAFAAQTVTLAAPTQAVLLLASVDDGGGLLGEILEAARTMDGRWRSTDDLSPAVAARLVEVDERRMTFRHPLVRSAVYQAASPAERRAAHAALAEVLGGKDDRWAWHRAAALVGPDERVAAALEDAAERARRRGAIGTAIRALERAVGLSEDGRGTVRRLLQAAELAFETGRRELARRLLDDAQRHDLSAAERQRIFVIRRTFSDVPTRDSGLSDVVDAAERIGRTGDRITAAELLLAAAGQAHAAATSTAAREPIVQASAALGLAADDARLVMIRAFAGTVDRGAEVISTISAAGAYGLRDSEAARLFGHAALVVGELELAHSFLTAAVDALRAEGRVALLAQALSLRAETHRRLDRWDVAVSDADEGRRLAEETGQPIWAASAMAFESCVAGLRGDEERLEVLAARAEQVALSLGAGILLTIIQWARGLAHLGSGRYEEAYERLVRAYRPDDPASHFSVRHFMIGDLAEAAAHAGRLDEARELMRETEAAVAAMASPAGRVAVEFARVMLAADEEAEMVFERALGGEPGRRPFVRARLQLALGAQLRRGRRVVESRASLRAARETFDALGAAGWAERAREELRASGVESRPRERGAMDELTPQELQIARMAASGLSNREISGRLFLSHRTVGAHLYRAFPKLGVASRGQLREVLDPAPS